MPTHQELPEQFGRYRILSKLGAGGMGALCLLLLLMVSVVCLLLAVAVNFLPPRADDTSEPKLPDKPADQKKDETIQLPELADRFTNKLKMQMVLIKRGTFKMGSPPEDKDKHYDEIPQHLVKITRDFYMGATEVTVGQFRQFVKEAGYKTEAEKEASANDSWQNNEYSTKDDQPVVYVSWNDAMAFCKWLGEKEGGKYYDLPREAEWEYACRAGGEPGDTFCFGKDREKLRDYAWFDGRWGGKTHTVGTKKADKWGLHDMHGNVWEWCKDGKRSYPDKATAEKQEAPLEDPEGPLNGTSRVLRGGSWSDFPWDCRSAVRRRSPPDHCYYNFGFRVVLRPGLRAP